MFEKRYEKDIELNVRAKPNQLLYLIIVLSLVYSVYLFVYLEDQKPQKYCHISSIMTYQQINTENLNYKRAIITEDTQFLFPIFPYGPNNQVHSFFESLKVAEVLNRTMVLTPMYRHSTDTKSDRDPYISPYLRMDMPTILQRYTLANPDDALEACGYKFDKLLISKKRKDWKRARLFQEYFGINIPKWKKPSFEKLEVHTDQEILNYYHTDEKCVIMYQPFKNILNLIGEYELLRFPKFVYDIASRFETTNNYDLTIHWRYNKKDWGQRCVNHIHERNARQCNIINIGLSPFDLYDLVIKFYENFETSLFRNYPVKIHIATPPTEINFVEDAKELIYQSIDDERISITTTNDMETFLRKNYDMECRVFRDYWNELVSLIEQAIVEKSGVFYFWPLSTWSERIIDLRNYQNPKDSNYFDIIDKLAEVRKDQKHPGSF